MLFNYIFRAVLARKVNVQGVPYLSKLLGQSVRDSADKTIGKLTDILISPQTAEYAPLEFLAVKRGSDKVLVPYSYVETLSSKEISLSAPFEKVKLGLPEDNSQDLLYLDKEVLDEQIVDVAGARVVRVNDLRLGLFNEQMCVLGIDISTRGILRRLNLEWMLGGFFKPGLIDWRHTQPVRGQLKLDTVAKNLNRLHPADLANVIEDLNVKAGSRLVVSMDAKAAAKVLEEVDPHLQKVLVKYLGPEKMAAILGQMSIDEVVDLFQSLSKQEAEQFFAYLKNNRARVVQKFIKYDDNTAGGLMTTDYITVKPGWTVARACEEVKKMSPSLRTVLYVYVLGEKNEFVGALSLRWLLISNPDELISNLVKYIPLSSVLHPEQSIDEVMNVMTKYDLYTAAVLDNNNHMLGIVTIDDVMRHLVPKA